MLVFFPIQSPSELLTINLSLCRMISGVWLLLLLLIMHMLSRLVENQGTRHILWWAVKVFKLHSNSLTMSSYVSPVRRRMILPWTSPMSLLLYLQVLWKRMILMMTQITNQRDVNLSSNRRRAVLLLLQQTFGKFPFVGFLICNLLFPFSHLNMMYLQTWTFVPAVPKTVLKHFDAFPFCLSFNYEIGLRLGCYCIVRPTPVRYVPL